MRRLLLIAEWDNLTPSGDEVRQFLVALSLLAVLGCGKQGSQPPTPVVPLAAPVFEGVEIAALDANEQPVTKVLHQSGFFARLRFRLRDGSPAVSILVLRIVRRDATGDLIFDERAVRVQKSDDGMHVVEALFTTYPQPGHYVVVAANGAYIVAQTPLEIVKNDAELPSGTGRSYNYGRKSAPPESAPEDPVRPEP
ncbi:MAG: hypothetical protein JNG89_15815 [Planctomycetaceae bacterium]|nr:hypothetical protein [Planctomycetaceae bacterium]